MELSNFWQALACALGWTVFHSLWQISLLYLVYRLAAWIWRRHSRALYLAACLVMAGSAVWAVVSFAGAWKHYAQQAEWEAEAALLLAMPIEIVQQQAPVKLIAAKPLPWYQQFDQIYESWAAPVGWLWCLGALVLALRLLGGYWLLRQVRQSGQAGIPEHWLQRCEHWRQELGIRRPVRWLESVRVSQPLTIGFWKPLVLFPAGMLLQLRPEQVEVLLLHELAHIRRYDYLVNLFQLALEVCFFYHPLFWSLSRAARQQREYCCDELVLRQQPERLLYAKTLTELQLSSITLNQFAMHAIPKSAFAQRILRIVNIRPDKAQRSPGFLLFLFILLTGTALSWSSFTKPAPPKPSEITLVLPEKSVPNTASAPTVFVPANLPESPSAQTLFAQSEAAPDTLPPSIVAVEVNKMNVFYIGIDNPITVAVPGYDCAALQVRLSGTGKLISKGSCQYIVQVREPGNVDIEIFSNENGQEQQLGVKKFRVKRIPDPVVHLEDYRSGYIHQDEIRNALNRELLAELVNFEFDAQCEIVEFKVAFWTDESTVVEYSVRGNIIPAEQIDFIEKNSTGKNIYILDIRAKCPGDLAARKLNDMVFTIRG